ncbi:MAG: hypothetical protein LBG93_00100 [Treponema sp.]|jgi:uncharacterized DUF497 family protein|nr:hypothetical protein [Treponema sp.]
MQIIWDNEKNRKLILERGFSLEKFAELILEKKYYAVLKNPSRTEQKIFIIPFQDYTYVVPFVIDAEQNIILKTAFPSRKYHKTYGGKK